MSSALSNTEQLSKRIAHYRRAFSKGLGHKPSSSEAFALKNAAALTAKAELAALDPDKPVEELYRLQNMASKARRELQAVLHPNKPEPDAVNELGEYLDQRVSA